MATHQNPEPPDPRDEPEQTKLGSPLRDGAVDPREGDYLLPSNAGEANPHGKAVVAPGLSTWVPDTTPRKPVEEDEAPKPPRPVAPKQRKSTNS